MMNRIVVFAAAAGLVLSLAGPSEAQPDPDDTKARDLYEQAERDYAAGRYERAVDGFRESFKLSQRSALLFNIANAEERRGNFRAAAAALREYVGRPDAEDVDSLTERIATLDRRAALADEQEKKRLATEAAAAKAAKTPVTGGGAASGGAPVAVDSERPSVVPGAVLVGAGGLAIVGGVTAGFLSRSASDDAESMCTDNICPESAKDDLDRSKTLALVADIAIVGGLGLAAVGTYLLIRRAGKSSAERSLSFDVVPSRDGVAAAVTGRF